MTDDIERRTWGVVLPNSPVPFAIIGPRGQHRQVLVRSADAPLDLVMLDLPSSEVARQVQSTTGSVAKIFSNKVEPRRLVVRGRAPLAFSKDSRGSFYSFAWLGNASKSEKSEVEEYFGQISADLAKSIESASEADVEWVVAPLLARCRLLQESHDSRTLIQRLVFLATFVIYGVLFVLIASRLIDRFPF